MAFVIHLKVWQTGLNYFSRSIEDSDLNFIFKIIK